MRSVPDLNLTIAIFDLSGPFATSAILPGTSIVIFVIGKPVRSISLPITGATEYSDSVLLTLSYSRPPALPACIVKLPVPTILSPLIVFIL